MPRPSVLRASEQREYAEWLHLLERIRESTPLPTDEGEDAKRARIANLQADFIAFCRYYFPAFMDADFAWFHKEAARKIAADKNIRAILEWPREHAKSVFADVFVPLWLYARGELTGVVIVSANEDKASGLLGDLQAQFVANERFIYDYGQRAAFGDWRDSHFATTDGCGFWAFGRGQSPRGVRKAAKRPNYAVVDDIDDKVIVKNQQRVREAVDWVWEDLYGALAIQGARLVVAGNRIHKHSILAHLVGDTEPDQPKREGITHVKVFALEDKRHRKDLQGEPAWKERYNRAQIIDRMTVMGTRSAMREYFHEHMEEGILFRHEWITWGKVPRVKDLDGMEVYTDPSFKDTKNNDFKAIVAVGKLGNTYYIYRCWLRQASVNAMVKTKYDFYSEYGEFARYRMEANFIQDLLLKDFDQEAEATGITLPLRADKRDKPNKETRIENLTPLFERGLVIFNERERDNPDMQTLVDQFLAFPTGHDDGPDAVEGAVYYLNRGESRAKFTPRMGRYRRSANRSL
jgi:predicted phage terminase large subunit-like protein